MTIGATRGDPHAGHEGGSVIPCSCARSLRFSCVGLASRGRIRGSQASGALRRSRCDSSSISSIAAARQRPRSRLRWSRVRSLLTPFGSCGCCRVERSRAVAGVLDLDEQVVFVLGEHVGSNVEGGQVGDDDVDELPPIEHRIPGVHAVLRQRNLDVNHPGELSLELERELELAVALAPDHRPLVVRGDRRSRRSRGTCACRGRRTDPGRRRSSGQALLEAFGIERHSGPPPAVEARRDRRIAARVVRVVGGKDA